MESPTSTDNPEKYYETVKRALESHSYVKSVRYEGEEQINNVSSAITYGKRDGTITLSPSASENKIDVKNSLEDCLREYNADLWDEIDTYYMENQTLRVHIYRRN